MLNLEIKQSTFERLQQHAEPLVDTTDSVVNRALDALEHKNGSAAPTADSSFEEHQIDPKRLPDLTHTKILDALLDGERVDKPNWNYLVDRILILAMNQFQNINELRITCPVNMVQGRKNNEGFRYVSEIDISVQGIPANEACRALVIAAQRLNLHLEIKFVWRSKEGAAYPGERARLRLIENLSLVSRLKIE